MIAPGGMLSGSAIGKNTFRRAPVRTVPDRAGIGSAKLRIRFLTSAAAMPGNRPKTSPAAPATCGVAIEVPLYTLYVLPGVVLRIYSPGAARSTLTAP